MYNNNVNTDKKLILSKPANFLLNICFIVLSLITIFIVAYFFGFRILRNPLTGNDALNNLTYASWIAEYYPKIPFWYPLAGGGTSFLIGYPSLYSLSVAVLHKNSSLTLVQAMGVLNFACLVLPAWGVFAFVWMRIKMRPAALFAGIFYLLSPISYVLISGAGFLSHAYSYIFSVPLLIFYDRYLEAWINKQSVRKKLFYLLIAGIFFVLTTLAHPVSSLGFMVIFGFYSISLGFSVDKFEGVKKGFSAILSAAVIFYLLSFFWFKPFQDFTNFSNRDITFIANTATLPPVKLAGILGLIGPQTGYPFPNLSIVPFVWIMALAGTILGLLKKNYKLFLLGIIVFACFYLMGSYTVWIALTKINWLLGSFFVNRYYYTATAVLPPIVAAVGLWMLVSLPVNPLIRRLKHFNIFISVPGRWMLSALMILLSAGISIGGLWILNPISGYRVPERSYMLHYGEEAGVGLPFLWNRSLDGTGVKNYCNKKEKDYAGIFCENPSVAKYVNVQTFVFYCSEFAKYDPIHQPTVCAGSKRESASKTRMLNDQEMLEFVNSCKTGSYNSPYYSDLCLSINRTTFEQLSKLPDFRFADFTFNRLETEIFSKPSNPFYSISKSGIRIDVTPSIGSWVKEWNVLNRSSMINAYTGQLVLNKSFQSYFRDIIYSSDLVKSSGAVNEAARYYGTSGIMTAESDQTNKFTDQNWKKLPVDAKKNRNLWQPTFDTGIYDLLANKKVLVIGSQSKQAYKQIFQLATLGVLPYDDALLFEGKEYVDAYSQNELNVFDVIVLHGYSYKNRNKAFTQLKNFLDKGGNIFIDTGWQYVSADWGGEKGTEFPEWFPVKKIQWGNAGESWLNGELGLESAKEISLSDFNPLSWEDTAWGLSYAETKDVAGKSILTVAGKVISASTDVGKGKIVWSGMNLPAHALSPENAKEIQFLKTVFEDLISNNRTNIPVKYSTERSPDKLTVEFDYDTSGSTFYFKEAYHPYWRASMIENKTKKKIPVLIHNVGPRFMGVILEEVHPGDRLIFEFDANKTIFLTSLISFLTFTGLVFFIIDVSLLKSKTAKRLLDLIYRIPLPGTNIIDHQIAKMKESRHRDEQDY